MTEPDRPLLAEAKEEIRSLFGELREMIGLRWQLARLEILADARSVAWLAVILLIAAAMIMTALPVLVVYFAEVLDGWTGVPRMVWLPVFGLGLLSTATLGGYLAWSRFRRRWIGLRETLEELHEDAVWLREWLGEQ